MGHVSDDSDSDYVDSEASEDSIQNDEFLDSILYSSSSRAVAGSQNRKLPRPRGRPRTSKSAAGLGKPLPESIRKLLALAYTSYANNQVSDCINYCLECIRLDPQIAQPYHLLYLVHSTDIEHPEKSFQYALIYAEITKKQPKVAVDSESYNSMTSIHGSDGRTWQWLAEQSLNLHARKLQSSAKETDDEHPTDMSSIQTAEYCYGQAIRKGILLIEPSENEDNSESLSFSKGHDLVGSQSSMDSVLFLMDCIWSRSILLVRLHRHRALARSIGRLLSTSSFRSVLLRKQNQNNLPALSMEEILPPLAFKELQEFWALELSILDEVGPTNSWIVLLNIYSWTCLRLIDEATSATKFLEQLLLSMLLDEKNNRENFMDVLLTLLRWYRRQEFAALLTQSEKGENQAIAERNFEMIKHMVETFFVNIRSEGSYDVGLPTESYFWYTQMPISCQLYILEAALYNSSEEILINLFKLTSSHLYSRIITIFGKDILAISSDVFKTKSYLVDRILVLYKHAEVDPSLVTLRTQLETRKTVMLLMKGTDWANLVSDSTMTTSHLATIETTVLFDLLKVVWNKWRSLIKYDDEDLDLDIDLLDCQLEKEHVSSPAALTGSNYALFLVAVSLELICKRRLSAAQLVPVETALSRLVRYFIIHQNDSNLLFIVTAAIASNRSIYRDGSLLKALQRKHPLTPSSRLLIGYCYWSAGTKSTREALQEFLQSYMLSSSSVQGIDQEMCSLIALLLSVTYLTRSMSRRSENRQAQVLMGLAWMKRYLNHRKSYFLLEALFNLGRFYQHLGWISPCISFYEILLDNASKGELEPAATDNSSLPMPNLIFETGYNLCLAYRRAGNITKAKEIFDKYCIL